MIKLPAFLKYIIVTLCISAPVISIAETPYSYVYIQGDKKTPFYVKADGKMAARYGKNHCIIPGLKAGTINIEILFQQNIYPPQSYTITVPGNGHKAYMLTQKEKGFTLYDLEAKTTIQPVENNPTENKQ